MPGRYDRLANESDGVVLVDVATIRSYVGRRFQLLSATIAWAGFASAVQAAVVVLPSPPLHSFPQPHRQMAYHAAQSL